jgi:hypothetical protein
MRVIAELQEHSANPAPRPRMIWIVVQYGAIRVKSKLQMTLAEKSQSQVQPRALQRCIVADCPPEAVGCLANAACAPQQRAEVVLARRVRVRAADGISERLLSLGRAAKEVERNTALIENAW